ncbi:proline dehydrogenase family protein [bacterium]|nr:proline dehydrogenase family protein [bacterium]
MIRPLLHFLSGSRLAKKFVLNFPLARKVARRYVAGERLEDALNVTRQLSQQGLLVALDLLGENAVRKADADKATEDYLVMVERVGASGLSCYFSLKLTQLGLDQGVDVAVANLSRILEKAKAHHLFVRIDMEGSKYTEQTVEVFRRAREQFDNVGIVIQAYLRRSKSDIAMINRLGGRVRLCKGAYAEPPSVAYQTRPEVTRNMKDLMYDLMRDGHYPAIASHDEQVIQETLRTVKEYGISPDKFEFQMLYGIRSQRQLELKRQGYNVRVYVPFGSDWYPYFMRRLAERPANLVFFLTALFRG